MTETPPLPPPGQPPPVNVTIRPEVAEGVYANFASVSESQYEISIDFININFATLTGAAVARVSMSHMLAQQLTTALNDSVARYANRVMTEEDQDHVADDEHNQDDPDGDQV